MLTSGGYSCGLKTRGGYMPGTCGGRRWYHFFFGGGPACSSTSAPTGSRGGALGGLLARDRLDLAGGARCARPIQICFGGRTCICEVTDRARRDLLRRAVEAEPQLAVRVLAVERDQHRRVGLVGHA